MRRRSGGLSGFQTIEEGRHMNHTEQMLNEARQRLSKLQYNSHWSRRSQGAPRPAAMLPYQAEKHWLEKRFSDTAQQIAKNGFTCSKRSNETHCGNEHSSPNRRSHGIRRPERSDKAGGDPDGDSTSVNSPALLSGPSSQVAADTQQMHQGAVLWRLPQVLAHIPVSKSTWWAGVKDGRYPPPVKLSSRCTAWRATDIVALVQALQSPKVDTPVSTNGKSVRTLHDRLGLPLPWRQVADSPSAGAGRTSFRKML